MKSIVALVLAGGFADAFSPENEPVFKALLPVRGRPIADYVIQALEESDVERIFVAQDEGVNLEKVLPLYSKCIFFNKDKQHSTMGIDSFFALGKVAEFYGDSELRDKMIMVVPCDTPLVTKDNINRLIHPATASHADVLITIIGGQHLERRYPQKRFHNVYLSDYRANYTLQNVLFIHGGLIQFNPSAKPGKRRFSFKGWDENVLKRVQDSLDSIVTLRHQPLFINRLLLLSLLTKGYSAYIFKLLVDLAFRRLTMAKLLAYLNSAVHLQSGYIESQETEFSGDIDRPEDFQSVLGILWNGPA